MVGKVLDISKILEILPYRYPMLLVDRFVAESENKFIGLKNLSCNEEVFVGHFPGHPIFPGVLQVEAMKQTAEIALKNKLDPEDENEIYIKSLSSVKFRRPNNPGDRMKIEVDLLKLENNIAEISATTNNNLGRTCQAKMELTVRPKVYPSEMPEMFTEFDKNENIKMDVNQIMALIPHRYPFLLVDYILCTEGTHVVGIKNISYNEPFFRGHLPGCPVLPGAIQAEIVAQAGCVHMLSRPENKGKIAYYLSIEQSEHYYPIHPGDQLIIEVDLPEGHSKFGRGKGLIRIGDKVISKTNMKFALVDP